MKRGVGLALALRVQLSVNFRRFIDFHPIFNVSRPNHYFSLVGFDYCQSWVCGSWHHCFLLLILWHSLNSLGHPVLLTASKSNTWRSLWYDTLIRVGCQSGSRCVLLKSLIEKLRFPHLHITATIKYFDSLAFNYSNFIFIFLLNFVYILVLVLFIHKRGLSYWA
jgi:hypothetical protein